MTPQRTIIRKRRKYYLIKISPDKEQVYYTINKIRKYNPQKKYWIKSHKKYYLLYVAR